MLVPGVQRVFFFHFANFLAAASEDLRTFIVAGRAKTSQRGALKTGQCFDDAYTSSV
jgi:hypothetical protein